MGEPPHPVSSPTPRDPSGSSPAAIHQRQFAPKSIFRGHNAHKNASAATAAGCSACRVRVRTRYISAQRYHEWVAARCAREQATRNRVFGILRSRPAQRGTAPATAAQKTRDGARASRRLHPRAATSDAFPRRPETRTINLERGCSGCAAWAGKSDRCNSSLTSP